MSRIHVFVSTAVVLSAFGLAGCGEGSSMHPNPIGPSSMVAVMMSQQFVMRNLAEHADVVPFAENIRDTQHAEIQMMSMATGVVRRLESLTIGITSPLNPLPVNRIHPLVPGDTPAATSLCHHSLFHESSQ